MPAEGDDRTFYAEFGRRLRNAREQHRLTQADVARSLGLTRASVTNVESGRQRLLVHQVAQLAALLDVDLADLIPRPAAGTADRAEIESKNEEIGRIFTAGGRA